MARQGSTALGFRARGKGTRQRGLSVITGHGAEKGCVTDPNPTHENLEIRPRTIDLEEMLMVRLRDQRSPA